MAPSCKDSQCNNCALTAAPSPEKIQETSKPARDGSFNLQKSSKPDASATTERVFDPYESQKQQPTSESSKVNNQDAGFPSPQQSASKNYVKIRSVDIPKEPSSAGANAGTPASASSKNPELTKQGEGVEIPVPDHRGTREKSQAGQSIPQSTHHRLRPLLLHPHLTYISAAPRQDRACIHGNTCFHVPNHYQTFMSGAAADPGRHNDEIDRQSGLHRHYEDIILRPHFPNSFRRPVEHPRRVRVGFLILDIIQSSKRLSREGLILIYTGFPTLDLMTM